MSGSFCALSVDHVARIVEKVSKLTLLTQFLVSFDTLSTEKALYVICIAINQGCVRPSVTLSYWLSRAYVSGLVCFTLCLRDIFQSWVVC